MTRRAFPSRDCSPESVISAMTVIGMTYISEIFPAKKRGAYQGWMMTIGLIGIPSQRMLRDSRFPSPAGVGGLVFIMGRHGTA